MGLTVADDGALVVSRSVAPLSASSIAVYRGGVETVVARVTDAPPAVIALRSAGAIAIASDGDLLVADTLGAQVVRITPTGQIVRLAGTGGCTAGPLAAPTPGPAISAALCGPELLARDDQGNIYVARKGARWIAKVDPGGSLSVLTSAVDVAGLAAAAGGALVASDATRGEIVRFQGGRSSVIVAGLDRPTSLAVGTDGAIFVLAEGRTDLLRIEVP
jgi:sugar lactone lactonase YvrE